MNKGKLIVISGPSGAGKGTVIAELFKIRSDLYYSVSCTTRKMREGEVNGREYIFISKEEFMRKIEEDMFLEYACFCDNYYGTPYDKAKEMMEKGKNVILEIETVGAEKVRKKCPESVSVFIMPPSAEVLAKRLIGRNTESSEALEKRLHESEREMAKSKDYDYVIINDALEDAVSELNEIINKL